MSIHGVRFDHVELISNWLIDLQVAERLGLSFKNACELNAVIDKSLPGWPSFVREEIMVDGEIFNVHYRNIIACIRSLFSNPDFAAVLVFSPEKHYTDASKTTRMYHDMHTGKWWWSTQVSPLTVFFNSQLNVMLE